MARKPLKFELNPLFSGPTMESRTKLGSPYREVPIGEIDVDPDQPRRMFEPEALRELSESIKEYGVISPILVRVGPGGTYRLVAGERRLRASKIAGLEKIPVVVDSGEEGADPLPKQLVENLQRQDLTPIERALAMGQLRERHGWSVRDIATHLGVSKSLVQRSLEILELPDDLQAALVAGAPESKVLMLAEVKDRDLRKELLSRLGELSRAEIELELGIEPDGEVSHRGTGKGGSSKVAKRTIKATGNRKLSVEDRRIVEEIQRTIGTKVELVRSKRSKDKGKISIDFYSSSDLYEMYRRLTA